MKLPWGTGVSGLMAVGVPGVISISAAIPRYASRAPRARIIHPNPMPQMFMTCATRGTFFGGRNDGTNWGDPDCSRFLKVSYWFFGVGDEGVGQTYKLIAQKPRKLPSRHPNATPSNRNDMSFPPLGFGFCIFSGLSFLSCLCYPLILGVDFF